MKNITVIQTAFLGDLLLTIPLLKRLRKNWPDAKIHLIGRREFKDLFLGLQLSNSYSGVDKSKGLRSFKGDVDLPDCDLLLVPHQSFSSARMSLKISSPIKIGYRKWWNRGVFSHGVNRPLHLPEAIRTLSLLAPLDDQLRLDIKNYELKYPQKNELRPVPPWASMELDSLSMELLQRFTAPTDPIDFHIPTIAMAPGSVWDTKRWTVDGFIQLNHSLQENGFQVVLTGSPAERALADQISNVTGAINLCGQLSLSQTMWVMQRCQAVLSNDSGAMHMASAVETPCVAIFGPTVLDFGYQPWQNRARVLERKDLDCRPCSSHGTKNCPLGHHHCMKKISAYDVRKMLMELIREQAS